MLDKHYVYEIFDRTGETKLGEWLDAPPPTFSIGEQGPEQMTITLPRVYGEMDAPGDPGSRDTLVTGNRVRVLVDDDDTFSETLAGAIVGDAVVGEARVGLATVGSRIVWQGFIAAYEPNPPAGVSVMLVPLSRILHETQLETALILSGDPVVQARYVVQTRLPGLGWDIDNPSGSGELADTMTFAAGQTIGQVLDALRRRAGSGWLLYVTELGTVRMTPPPASASHTLTLGAHAVNARLREDSTTRRKRIVVYYANGGVEAAQAADYLATDPRAESVQAAEITNGTDAQRLARLTLLDRDRVLLSGSCTIIDREADLGRLGVAEGYDIESIKIGDGVSLQVERDSIEPGGPAAIVGAAVVGDATVGGGSYAETLVVARVTYKFWYADVEFGMPSRQNFGADLAVLERDLAAHIAAGM